MPRPKTTIPEAVAQHLHEDFADTATRRDAFLAASEPVRREVLARLVERSVVRGSNLSLGAIIVALVAIAVGPNLQHPATDSFEVLVTLSAFSAAAAAVVFFFLIDGVVQWAARRAAFWLDIYTRDLPAAPPPTRRGLFRRP